MLTDGRPRPTAVKWIVALSWLRIALGLMVIVLAVAAATPGWPVLESFRRGWLEGMRYDPGEYGYEDAGYVTGRLSLPLLFPALLLGYLRSRRLRALRVVAVLDLLTSLVRPVTLLLTVPSAVLVFGRSTKRYCAPDAPEDGRPRPV